MTRKWGLAALWALTLAAPALGATVYTSESAFLTVLEPNYYLEEFSNYDTWGLIASPIAFTDANGWQYNVSASFGSLWGVSTDGGDGALSTEWPDPLLTITPTGSQEVKAIGGWFFATDWDGYLMAGTIRIELSDGTVEEYTSSTIAYDFRGFTSSVPITSLSVSVPGNPHDVNYYGAYPTLDHVYVGVPEPATMSLLVLGGLVGLIRRKGHK
jgi:hypothetical protein